jgi:enoyl-CoA hydratase
MTFDPGSHNLRFEVRDSVAWLTIDRPHRRNALTMYMYLGIKRAVDHLNQSSELNALVITGTGDVFAPGGEMGGVHDDGADPAIAAAIGTASLPFPTIRESRKPVVSMVNGLCMGGGLLIAMMSDVAVASDRATFGAPELRRGVADSFYGAFLPEHVPITIARDMLFTGRRLTAAEAERHGLVARVVAHDDLLAETERVLEGLLLSAPKARMHLKRMLNARYGAVDWITFEDALASDEVVEGFTSFLEKRAPAWVPEHLRDRGRA